MKKILVIKHGALGDFVLALGTLEVLKREHADAEMWLVTTTGMVPMARATGLFSGYIVDDRGGKRETLTVIRHLAGSGFSVFYDFQQSQRVRIYRKMLRWMLPPGEYRWIDTKNRQIFVLTKRTSMGIGKVRKGTAHIPWTRTDLSRMKAEGKHFDLLPQGPYVLLIPGCSAKNVYKRWGVQNYCEIADRLGKAGIRVVVLGTAEEIEECNTIAHGRDWVVNMAGLTALTDVPQVALRSIAVLGNDTGPTHIAAMTGRYTIGIFDHRNTRSVLRGECCDSIVSPGGVELIRVDEVWDKLIYKVRGTKLRKGGEKEGE